MTSEPMGDDQTGSVAAGTVIASRFEVQHLLNIGGMGEVYRGLDRDTGQPVALKIVLPALSEDANIAELLENEAQTLASLSHDSVVRTLGMFRDETLGRACLVMAMVEGDSLATLLDDGTLPEATVRALMHRLAAGLEEAHRIGVIHADLSPNNIILPGKDVARAKIIDFGIALSHPGRGSVAKGQFAGTLAFVAPEQLGRYGGRIDARSDVYALGLLAAACCRGEPVDMGDTAEAAIARRQVVPDISDVYPGLRPILEYMLAPNPSHRPRSMAEVMCLLQSSPEVIATLSERRSIPAPDDAVPMPTLPPGAADGKTTPPG